MDFDSEAFGGMTDEERMRQAILAMKGQQAQGPSTGDRVGGALKGGLSGAATGATIGSAIPGIGTAIGAAIGGGLGLLSGGMAADGADAKQSAADAQTLAGQFKPAAPQSASTDDTQLRVGMQKRRPGVSGLGLKDDDEDYASWFPQDIG